MLPPPASLCQSEYVKPHCFAENIAFWIFFCQFSLNSMIFYQYPMIFPIPNDFLPYSTIFRILFDFSHKKLKDLEISWHPWYNCFIEHLRRHTEWTYTMITIYGGKARLKPS